jgi:hypothetical protein
MDALLRGHDEKKSIVAPAKAGAHLPSCEDSIRG